MPVIAMTREMGSLGKDVARGLARRLGLELVQHELVSSLAEKMKLKESAVTRYLTGKSTYLQRGHIVDNRLALFTAEEIFELARRGNVLVRGWGAAYILRQVPHVLSLRVCAPIEFRARVLMERVGLTDYETALREVKHNDGAHANTMRRLFAVNWDNADLYDLVLNRQHLSADECINIVTYALTQPTFEESPESLQILEDKALEARIFTALKSNAITSRPSQYFEVKVKPGTTQVLLTGVVPDEQFRQEAGRVVKSVEGVSQVINDLMSLRSRDHDSMVVR